MTISADETRDTSVAVQPSSRVALLTKKGSVGAGCSDRQPSALRLHNTPRWLSKGSIAHFFQKKAPRLSSSTREGVEHSATDDCELRHASRGRQVALRVAQRAASLTRLLASRNSFSAKNLPAIDSRHSEDPSSLFSSRSAIIPPRRAHSYGTYPTTSSIGQTLLMDTPRPALSNVGTSNAMPLQPAASMSADSLTTAAGASRRHANKSFSRLVQAYPDISAEAHKLCDFACSLDHAGIRWYGRMYVSSTHLYFSGTGISLSSNTGACKARNGLVQSKQQQASVPVWTPAQCSSSLSLASTPSLSQEYASYELHSQRPLYGPYSQPSTRLTFSMDEIPQQTQKSASQSASQSSKRNSLGDRSSMAKPLRRTAIKLALSDITRVTKELTLGIWPNAMTVSTTHRQYIFTNFLRRDKAYQCLYDVWNSTLPVSSQMQPLPRAKQRPRIPEQYTTQQQLAVPLAHTSTEEASLQPLPLALSATANDSPHQQIPLQADVVECTTTNIVAACHRPNAPLVAPPSAEAEDTETANRALVKWQSKSATLPRQHVSHTSNAHKIHHNNHNFFAWQRLDPVMLVGQLIGVVSRSTLFILLSLVVFCLLSSITFL